MLGGVPTCGISGLVERVVWNCPSDPSGLRYCPSLLISDTSMCPGRGPPAPTYLRAGPRDSVRCPAPSGSS